MGIPAVFMKPGSIQFYSALRWDIYSASLTVNAQTTRSLILFALVFAGLGLHCFEGSSIDGVCNVVSSERAEESCMRLANFQR